MYRKTYFCVCEGPQEEMYLKRVAFLLKKFPERVVTFNSTKFYGLNYKRICREFHRLYGGNGLSVEVKAANT